MKENNKWKYQGDGRYERVYERMQFLGIQDVTTNRQHGNGTIVWRLPIKNNNSGKTFIEVASFSTGYVRNQNSGYSNYQLNKRCMSEPQYYPERKYNPDTSEHVKTGKYLKSERRGCKLIPIEIDRLEYLISYCLKNYYIKRANEVADGNYVSQSYHDFRVNQKVIQLQKVKRECNQANIPRAMDRINDLEEKLEAMTEDRDCKNDRVINLSLQYEVLENKLATINRISE